MPDLVYLICLVLIAVGLVSLVTGAATGGKSKFTLLWAGTLAIGMAYLCATLMILAQCASVAPALVVFGLLAHFVGIRALIRLGRCNGKLPCYR